MMETSVEEAMEAGAAPFANVGVDAGPHDLSLWHV